MARTFRSTLAVGRAAFCPHPPLELLERGSNADAIRRQPKTFVSRQSDSSDSANPEAVDVSLRRNCLALPRIGDSPLDRQALWFLRLHADAALGDHAGSGEPGEP